MPLISTVVISLAVAAVVIAGYLAWVALANRRLGVRGPVRTVQLACPKCGVVFDYDLLPGASATSLRLGRSRYMSCPACRRWSVIRVSPGTVAPSPPADGRSGPPPG